MYNEVTLGLTGVQAEYLRGLVDHAADELAEDLESGSPSMPIADLEESLSYCETIVSKLTQSIDEFIRLKARE